MTGVFCIKALPPLFRSACEGKPDRDRIEYSRAVVLGHPRPAPGRQVPEKFIRESPSDSFGQGVFCPAPAWKKRLENVLSPQKENRDVALLTQFDNLLRQSANPSMAADIPIQTILEDDDLRLVKLNQAFRVPDAYGIFVSLGVFHSPIGQGIHAFHTGKAQAV
ncbi:MAG TPA: hypothetical protein VKV04_10855 [Verrucomicrobiae bacterium]|nr:hypothetical protein [Verrucomicrobiae bacterium]